MIKLSAFLALEQSLSDRLIQSVRLFLAPVVRDIEGALDRGEFDEAHRLATTINLSAMADDVRDYVLWVTNLSMLFGASRVTSRPGTSVVGMGYEKLNTQQFTETFLNTAIPAGQDHLIEQVMQLIAQRKQAAATPEVVSKIDTASLTSYDPKKRVLTPFETFMDEQGKAYFNMVAALHNSRVSAYGFTAEASALGLSEYQINEQLDKRACMVCAAMHGRVFRVTDARALLNVVLRVSSKEDFKHLQPWPKQNEETVQAMNEMPAHELVAKGWHIPPFHPKCRGLLTRVGKTPKLSEVITGTAADSYKVSEAEFQNLGMSLTSQQLKLWESMVKQSPAQMLANLQGKPLDNFFEDLLKSETPKQQAGIKSLTFTKTKVHLKMEAPAFKSKEPVNLDVVLDANKKALHIKQMTVADGENSPKLFKKLMQAVYGVAQEAEVDHLTLPAHGEGGFAYAKYGFQPSSTEWGALKKYVNKALLASGAYGDASIPVLKALQGILASDSPDMIYALADLGPVGKKALTNSKWLAMLPLQDAEAVGRFLVFFGD